MIDGSNPRDYILSTSDTALFSRSQIYTATLYLRKKVCSDVIDKIIINTIIVYLVIDCTDELCKIVVDWQILQSIHRST